MNLHAIRAIFSFEMARTLRTILQSIVSPVVSTSPYFVVFGSPIVAPARPRLVRAVARWRRAPPAEQRLPRTAPAARGLQPGAR